MTKKRVCGLALFVAAAVLASPLAAQKTWNGKRRTARRSKS